MKEFYVEIAEKKTHKVIEKIGPYSSERMAEKSERGVNINLNHDEYYTDVTTDLESDDIN